MDSALNLHLLKSQLVLWAVCNQYTPSRPPYFYGAARCPSSAQLQRLPLLALCAPPPPKSVPGWQERKVGSTSARPVRVKRKEKSTPNPCDSSSTSLAIGQFSRSVPTLPSPSAPSLNAKNELHHLIYLWGRRCANTDSTWICGVELGLWARSLLQRVLTWGWGRPVIWYQGAYPVLPWLFGVLLEPVLSLLEKDKTFFQIPCLWPALLWVV